MGQRKRFRGNVLAPSRAGDDDTLCGGHFALGGSEYIVYLDAIR